MSNYEGYAISDAVETFRTSASPKMFGIANDSGVEDWIWQDENGVTHQGARQRYYSGGAWHYADNQFGDITTHDAWLIFGLLDNTPGAMYFSDPTNILFSISTTTAQKAVDVNIDKIDVDFNVGASSIAHALFVQGSDGLVGIGTGTLQGEALEVDGAIILGDATGTFDGTLRYTGTDFEGYLSGGWVSLTGPLSSVTNAVDDRIATFSGSDSLNGEAGLTFNGYIFRILASIPKMYLTVDSGTAGHIKFNGLNDGCKIRYSDTGSDSQLQFYGDDTGDPNLTIYGNAATGGVDIDADLTISKTITVSSMSTGSDNSVVVKNSSNHLVTDEIDSRVWGSTLADDTDLAGIQTQIDALPTLANGANNRVITAVDASDLNGEANLTFDGSILGISATTPSELFTVSGTYAEIKFTGLYHDCKIKYANDGDYSALYFYGDASGSETMSISGDGKIYAEGRLYANGGITANGDVSTSGDLTVNNNLVYNSVASAGTGGTSGSPTTVSPSGYNIIVASPADATNNNWTISAGSLNQAIRVINSSSTYSANVNGVSIATDSFKDFFYYDSSWVTES